MVDGGIPVTVFVALNVRMPYDERTDTGWEEDDLIKEIKSLLGPLTNPLRGNDIAIEDVSLVDETEWTITVRRKSAPTEPAPEQRADVVSPSEESAAYRAQMRDAGRGHLLRG